MNGVQTRLKCKPNVKQCKRLVFPARSALFNHNILNTKAISHFQANHILIRFVFPPLQAVKETVRRLDERMVLLKKEPERRLVTYRLESASKAVVTTASALILALIISVWTNCNQYRTNRLLKDADLKYRAIRICLPGDDPDIAFLEKHFTIKRDEEKIRRVERLVTAFEDSVRNRIRNHEMAAYKDSLAHRLFREAQEIRKQLDNPNSK